MSFVPLLAGVVAFAASVAGAFILILVRRRIAAIASAVVSMAILLAGTYVMIRFLPLTPDQHDSAVVDGFTGFFGGLVGAVIVMAAGNR